MKLKGTKTVKLADMTTNLFVRKALDNNHVLYLAELIGNGVEMRDFIEVTDNNEIVDGRHRKEAYELNKTTEVKVKVLEFDSEAEMIAYAYKSNTGGSKPPTSADTEHTVMLLLECGETIKHIGERLALPSGMTRRYVNEVKSRMNRQKLQKAAVAVTDGGLTVAKAAEQYEVDSEKLKEVLSGNRRKHKQGVQDVQRNLTNSYKTIGLKNASALRKLLEKFEDGDVTEKQVYDIFQHLEGLQKQSGRSLADWKKRFMAMTTGAKSTKGAKTA